MLIYITTDHSCLDKNVVSVVQDYDNTFCTSFESVKELIIVFKNKGFRTTYKKNDKKLMWQDVTPFFSPINILRLPDLMKCNNEDSLLP